MTDFICKLTLQQSEAVYVQRIRVAPFSETNALFFHETICKHSL